MACIYQITNMATGHFYIGSAASFERRSWQHRYDLRRGAHKNPRLQAAWKKYGEEAFVFEVLEQVPDDVDMLVVEDRYLAEHVGKRECYNVNPSATAPRRGQKLSEASKTQLSANRTGKHAGPNHYRFGQKLSAAVREKIGAAQRGKPKGPGRTVSEEGRARIRANIEAGLSHKHWVGRKHTPEARAKMSKSVCATSPEGVATVYPSITALREALALKPSTVNRALESGKPLVKGPRAGWTFAYQVP